MKIIANVCRVFVGVLFVVSGFVKIVDPIGTAIKLEEYFVVFSSNFSPLFEFFIPYALTLSVFITALEIILGVALLLLFQVQTTIYLLFAQIAFFTILTFYSAFTGEVTDCGCFGDAMPLTPWQSFSKDAVLMVLIIILFLYRNKFTSVLDTKKGVLAMAFTTVACLVFAKYNLDHLPVIDFRPYKIGNNITEKRNDGKPGVFHYKMEKDGVEKVFETYPSDWNYKEVITVVEPKLPSINDFTLFNANGDETTDIVLEGKTLLLVVQKTDVVTAEQAENLAALVTSLKGSNINISLLTGSGFEKGHQLVAQMKVNIPVYIIDEVVIKAMIRANPGLLLMNNGVVKMKWHYNDLPTAEEVIAKAE